MPTQLLSWIATNILLTDHKSCPKCYYLPQNLTFSIAYNEDKMVKIVLTAVLRSPDNSVFVVLVRKKRKIKAVKNQPGTKKSL